MNKPFVTQLQSGLDDLKSKGTLKKLNYLSSPQSAQTSSLKVEPSVAAQPGTIRTQRSRYRRKIPPGVHARRL